MLHVDRTFQPLTLGKLLLRCVAVFGAYLTCYLTCKVGNESIDVERFSFSFAELTTFVRGTWHSSIVQIEDVGTAVVIAYIGFANITHL